MLPPEQTFKLIPFRLAQISPAEWIQGWRFRSIIWKANMFVCPLATFDFKQLFFLMQFRVRPVFHCERVLKSFNMAILGTRTSFYT